LSAKTETVLAYLDAAFAGELLPSVLLGFRGTVGQ